MIDKKTFFAYARKAPFGGRLTQAQVDGMAAILDAPSAASLSDEKIAYVLATVFHETGANMQPVRENMSYSASRILQVFGKNHSAKVTAAEAKTLAGNPKALAERVYGLGNPSKAREFGNTVAGYGYKYRGGGMDQRTGFNHYKRVGLQNNPDKVLELSEAVRVMIVDMIAGAYTGKKLSDYFNANGNNPIAARAIINGTDKAKLIAGYYQNFLDALQAGRKAYSAGVMPADVAPADAVPDDIPALESGNAIALPAIPALGAGALTLVNGVNNLYSLLTILGLALLALFAWWLISSGRITFNRLKK